jgi:hypothetical protein
MMLNAITSPKVPRQLDHTAVFKDGAESTHSIAMR